MTARRRVDRSDHTPAYRQLAGIIREQIIDGALPAGAELPSEADLATEHGLNKTTVRQSMGVLRAEGLIVSERGRRSRVRPVRVSAARRYAAGKAGYGGADAPEFASEHGVSWDQFETTRDYRTVPAPARVALALGIEPGTPVVERRWTHATGGVVLRVSWSYLDANRWAGSALVDPDAPANPGGTIAAMAEAGHDVIGIRTEVTARLASPEEQTVLQLPAGAAVLEAWRVQRTAASPVECARHVYPAGSHVLTFDTSVPSATAGWAGPAPD